MNTAQKTIKKLAEYIKEKGGSENELNFLDGCFNAWEGYTEMEISYPHWQMKALEEKYGMTIGELNSKYKYENM